jgi:hypothetical protein
MSNKKTYYKQCRLQKGNAHQMSWIPEEFAVKDKVIKLRSEGVWDDGWIVKEAYSTRLETNDLPDSHSEIKSHRKATGDAMPKK